MMEWNVYYYNCNAKKMQKYNVLKYQEDTIIGLRLQSESYGEFVEKLKNEMMYHYWCKFEWEISIESYGGLTDRKEAIRVDAWDQIRLNWDRFVDYCWEYQKDSGDDNING